MCIIISVDKIAIIKDVAEGSCTVTQAAEHLDISEKSVRRLVQTLKEHGEDAMRHGNSGRKPANRLDEALVEKILALRESDAYER